MDDLERLQLAYRPRRAPGEFWDASTYNLLNPAVYFNEEQFRSTLVDFLSREGLNASGMSRLRVLEVGCGWGRNLNFLLELGCLTKNLCGVDLMEHHIAAGKELNPGLNLSCGNGENLEFEEMSFDIILFHTVFSALLDINIQRNLFAEAVRVLRPAGSILIYDILQNYSTGTFDDKKHGKIVYIKGINPKKFSEFAHGRAYVTFKKTLGLSPKIRHLILQGPWNVFFKNLTGKKPGCIFSRNRLLLAGIGSLLPGLGTHFFLAVKKS